MTSRFLGNGLVVIEDYETWRPRRKLYDPAFNKSYLKALCPKFNSCVELFLDKLAPHSHGTTEVPMKKHICATTLDIIGKARRRCLVAFASDFDSEWNHMPLLLKHSRATGVGSLLDHTFFGMQKAMDNPLYQTSCTLSELDMVANQTLIVACEDLTNSDRPRRRNVRGWRKKRRRRLLEEQRRQEESERQTALIARLLEKTTLDDRDKKPRERDAQLVRLTEKDDIETYLTTFEQVMEAYEMDKNRWTFKLAPYLSREETFRLRFRSMKKKTEETYRELEKKLQDTVKKWLPEYESKDELMDVLVKEQFVNSLPTTLQVGCWRGTEPVGQGRSRPPSGVLQ
eukprot:Em0002g737a